VEAYDTLACSRLLRRLGFEIVVNSSDSGCAMERQFARKHDTRVRFVERAQFTSLDGECVLRAAHK
jgi:hypothetical protein